MKIMKKMAKVHSNSGIPQEIFNQLKQNEKINMLKIGMSPKAESLSQIKAHK